MALAHFQIFPPKCSRGCLEIWLARPYQFSVSPCAHRLLKYRIKGRKGVHNSLIHRMFPLHMVFIMFIAPRTCSECSPGEKWGNFSGFRVSPRGTSFLCQEAGWLTALYNAGGMTWGSMGALNMISIVNSLNLGLNKELFHTHLNFCPH